MVKHSLTHFLGAAVGSRKHDQLLERLSLDPRDKKLVFYKPSSVYHCYYNQGIALCFEGSELDSIDFYSEAPGRSPEFKYQPVSKARVPEGIEYDATAERLVQLYGEPIQKGGGMKAQMDVWLRWEGVQFEIPTRNWEAAKDLVWSSCTIFRTSG